MTESFRDLVESGTRINDQLAVAVEDDWLVLLIVHNGIRIPLTVPERIELMAQLRVDGDELKAHNLEALGLVHPQWENVPGRPLPAAGDTVRFRDRSQDAVGTVERIYQQGAAWYAEIREPGSDKPFTRFADTLQVIRQKGGK